MEQNIPAQPSSFSRVLRSILRSIKWLVIGLLLLIVALAVALLLPPVQKYALNKGTTWFNNTTGGELSIREVDVRLPYFIHLDGVLLTGPERRQIAQIESVKLSLGWRMIFNKMIRVDRVELVGLKADMVSDANGNWNYDFIVDAFTDSTTVADTSESASSWDFSIGTVKLSDIELAYYDKPSRDSITTSFGRIYLEFNRFTLNNTVFIADAIEMENSNSFVQLSATDENIAAQNIPADSEPTQALFPEIAVATLKLANHEVNYRITDGSMDMKLSLGMLEAKSKDLDIENNRYSISSLSLHNTAFEMQTVASASPDTAVFDYDIFIPFDITVDLLEASGNQVHLTSMDFNEQNSKVDLADLVFNAKNVRIKPDQYAIDVQSIAGAYGNDLDVSNLSVSLDLRPTSLSISNLDLAFGQSSLEGQIEANFESLQKLAEDGNFEKIELDIPELILHPDDLLRINRMAGIHDTSMVSIPSAVSLSTRISGNRQKIEAPHFSAKMGDSRISMTGNSAGPEFSQHEVKLKKMEVFLALADISTYLPADFDFTAYPPTYALKGTATASKEKASLTADLDMEIGSLEIDVYTGGWDAESFPVIGTLQTDMLNLSGLSGLDSLLVVFDMQADIEDITTDQRSGELILDLYEIDYGKYRLNNTCLNLDFARETFEYSIEVDDSSAMVDISGQAALGDSIMVTAVGDVKGIDLEYLGLTNKDFRTQFNFNAEYHMVDSFMWGDLLINRTTVIREDKRTDFDPITASFALLSDSSGAQIKSEVINMKASSNLMLNEIASHLRALFKDQTDDEIRKDGYFTIQVETGDEDIIGDIFPEIKALQQSMLSVDYSAHTGYIDAKARFPKIRYDVIEIDSMNLDLQGSAGSIAGSFGISHIAYDSLAMEGIRLGLTPANEGNDFSFQINNGMDSAQYFMQANIKHIVENENKYWKIDPTEVFTLDGKEWAVDPLAQILIKDSLYGIEDFNLTRNKNFLSIHTPMDDQELHLKANNFSLVYISKLFTLDQNLLEGRLNLDMDLRADGTFDGKADINGLIVFGADFGRFDLIANAKNGTYSLEALLEGPTMDLEAKGTLISKENNDAEIDIKSYLTRFDLGSLERLIPTLVSKSNGIGTGALKVEGTTSNPLLSGKLMFKDISMQMVNNRAQYLLRNEQIDLEPNIIRFPSFTVRDSALNKLVINGEIQHSFFRNRVYDLSIESDNFTLVDLLPGDDPFVYGKLIVGTDISISGTDQLPVIRSDLALKKGSGIVFQLPEEKYDDMSFDGLVEWVSFEEKVREANRIIDAQKSETQAVQQSSSVNLSGALKIDPETNLKIVIDPLAGDNINIKGGGTLGMGYDRSGQLSLNGTYRVTSGSYEMTFYNIVKRSFSIRDGSTIMWNGDPYNPQMNITAVYKTRIPLASLMGSQAGNAGNESLRRPADFELHMTLSGGLEETEVSFQIKLAEQSRGMLNGAADARVAQINDNETELNRQVFAMLVLNTFVNDAAPSSGSEALANEARNSASQILTNQLNTLSDKFIGGAVDLNFDMMSYQGADGNAETDLSIDVSKSLFNERIVIKVGSTVPIEGNNTAGANGSNELITNIIVEYKITPDGRYNFKVFRKEDLDDILVGRLTRTGVGVMFRREFDSNTDIFKLTEEERKPSKDLKDKEETEEE